MHLINAISLPLVVAIVASCATSANSAYILAQVLVQQNAINFAQGKGHYNQKQLANFKDQPETLLSDLEITPNTELNLTDFEFATC